MRASTISTNHIGVTLGFLLLGAAAAPACNSSAPTSDVAEPPAASPTTSTEGANETGASFVVGATKVSDDQNNVVLDLPAGWYALVPTLGRGSISFMSEHSAPLKRDDDGPGLEFFGRGRSREWGNGDATV